MAHIRAALRGCLGAPLRPSTAGRAAARGGSSSSSSGPGPSATRAALAGTSFAVLAAQLASPASGEVQCAPKRRTKGKKTDAAALARFQKNTEAAQGVSEEALLARCERWLAEPQLDPEGEEFNLIEKIEQLDVEFAQRSLDANPLRARLIELACLLHLHFSVQMPEDWAGSLRDLMNLAEGCPVGQESCQLLLVQAHAGSRLANASDFEYYARGFASAVTALVKLKHADWLCHHNIRLMGSKYTMERPWDLFTRYMHEEWRGPCRQIWKRSKAVWLYKKLEFDGHEGAKEVLEVLSMPCLGMAGPKGLESDDDEETWELSTTMNEGDDGPPPTVHFWGPRELWHVDRPEDNDERELPCWNNSLLELLEELREEADQPNEEREAARSLANEVADKLSSLPNFVRVDVQDANARGTSMSSTKPPHACGPGSGEPPAAPSDVDLVVLFGGEATTGALHRVCSAMQEHLGRRSYAGGSRFSFDRGRCSIVVHLSDIPVEVSVVPAVIDPAGGHWILDGAEDELLHCNPEALSNYIDSKGASLFGWVDIVLLCKFLLKRLDLDGAMLANARAPLTSLHIEAALCCVEGPLPHRIDAAFLAGIRCLQDNLLETTVPEAWTGYPVEQYLLFDRCRLRTAEKGLARAREIATKAVKKGPEAPVEIMKELFNLTDGHAPDPNFEQLSAIGAA